jgi:hypothetical protein
MQLAHVIIVGISRLPRAVFVLTAAALCASCGANDRQAFATNEQDDQSTASMSGDVQSGDGKSSRSALAGLMDRLSSGAKADVEPSEADMRGALESKAEALHSGQEALAEQCREGSSNNNVGDAVLCVAQGLSGGPMHLSVQGFRKIACEKAEGRPGYNCDYEVQLNVGPDANPGALGILGTSGGECTGRFVKTSDGWSEIDPDCR